MSNGQTVILYVHFYTGRIFARHIRPGIIPCHYLDKTVIQAKKRSIYKSLSYSLSACIIRLRQRGETTYRLMDI